MRLPQVLIVSNDAEFVREIVSCWEQKPDAPRLTIVSPEIFKQSSPLRCPIAVVGPARNGGPALSSITLPFEAGVCAVVEPGLLRSIRDRHPEWLLIPEQPGWPEVLFGLTREMLRRTVAEDRAEDAEKSELAHKRLAVLGELLVEERPALVNVLTSLVGNADLMLLSEQPLSADGAEQTQTIHAMALRLNEILQRLFVLTSGAPSLMRGSQGEIEEKRANDLSERDRPATPRREGDTKLLRSLHD